MSGSRRVAFLMAIVLLMTTAACRGDDEAEFIEVPFDGAGCTVSRESVPAGEWAFVVTDNSDVGVDINNLYVSSLIDGHTFQDVLDLQTEVGGPPNYYPKPDWVVYEETSWAARRDIELAENQSATMRVLTAGTDAVYLYTRDDELWFCAPLEVIP